MATNQPNVAAGNGDAAGTLPVALPSLGDIVTQYGAHAIQAWPELVALGAVVYAVYRRNPAARRQIDAVLGKVIPGGRR